MVQSVARARPRMSQTWTGSACGKRIKLTDYMRVKERHCGEGSLRPYGEADLHMQSSRGEVAVWQSLV